MYIKQGRKKIHTKIYIISLKRFVNLFGKKILLLRNEKKKEINCLSVCFSLINVLYIDVYIFFNFRSYHLPLNKVQRNLTKEKQRNNKLLNYEEEMENEH
jgi:hypothetical protein